MRLYAAGLVAFLIGVPFTSTVFGGVDSGVGQATGDFIESLINASSGGS